MPSRAPSLQPCGCIVPAGRRCECARQRDRERKAKHDATRPNAHARGYATRQWREASRRFLARPENRLCACGCGREADMVDHKIAHKGDMRLFWAETNWQPMANNPCNRRKAVREEGAFGRPKVDQGAGGIKNPRLADYRDAQSCAELSALEKEVSP